MSDIRSMFDAEAPDENVPARAAAPKKIVQQPTLTRRTFTLAESVIDAATNAQKGLRGVYPGAHGSLNSFIEAAIAEYTHKLEEEYNGGEPFPEVEKVRRRKARGSKNDSTDGD
ncbi:hypothetical protein [Rhodococcus aetherivorans]|uniref:hypothetical protein n=1 Tax=Rhodococcus aetherivorans TaxID=191292 RepID=UPI0002D2466A|nr:hypothetical protein [Rhodococcus aetherivorans]CCW15275.1 hypothetical protein EBESD8_58470 [Rhodococcus aetherivorans]